MTRPPKFEIDLAEEFATLHHAPIVEAVIQFNAPPTKVIEPTQLKQTLEQRFDDFAISDQVQLETRLSGSPGNMETHHKSQWDGYRLTSQDGKHICQWKRNCLIFSRLKPYETWSDFLEVAMPFWNAYREIVDPEVIENIGLRFISQIPLKENEQPSKFVQQVPLPLKGLGLRADSFFHQDTLPLKGYPYEVRLIRAMQPAAERTGSKRVLIVDIDVSTEVAVVFDQLETTLKEMRYIKNKVFFTYMKDAENRFK